MIRKSDIQWWVQEIRKDPAVAPLIIEELANRLAELDQENEELRGELIKLRAGDVGASSSKQVSQLQERVETLQTIVDGQASTETAVVLISDQGQTARLPISQIRLRLRHQQVALKRTAMLSLRCMVLARPQDDVLLVTTRGRGIKLLLHKIPFLVEATSWPASEIALEAGERISTAAVLGERPRFWSVVTRRGFVQQFLHAHLDRLVKGGQPLINKLERNDEPIAVVSGDKGDLLLLTRWGKAVRFPQYLVGNQGVTGIQLEPDDEVAAALPLASDTEMLALTAAGFVLRRESKQFKRQAKPGASGKPFIQAFDTLATLPYIVRGKLLFLSYSGKLQVIAPTSIPLHTRLGKGTQVEDFSRDPAVGVVFVPGSLL